jgi:hypothetical protein
MLLVAAQQLLELLDYVLVSLSHHQRCVDQRLQQLVPVVVQSHQMLNRH